MRLPICLIFEVEFGSTNQEILLGFPSTPALLELLLHSYRYKSHTQSTTIWPIWNSGILNCKTNKIWLLKCYFLLKAASYTHKRKNSCFWDETRSNVGTWLLLFLKNLNYYYFVFFWMKLCINMIIHFCLFFLYTLGRENECIICIHSYNKNNKYYIIISCLILACTKCKNTMHSSFLSPHTTQMHAFHLQT
jgi:hypothetical protein